MAEDGRRGRGGRSSRIIPQNHRPLRKSLPSLFHVFPSCISIFPLVSHLFPLSLLLHHLALYLSPNYCLPPLSPSLPISLFVSSSYLLSSLSLIPHSYSLFLSEQRQKGKFDSMSMSQLSKTIGKMWGQLPPQAKQVGN